VVFCGCSLVTWLYSSTLSKCICQILSFNPSSPHYNPRKVILIILCILYSSGGEFESLVKHMIDCIIQMSLSEPLYIFKYMSESDPHFPKWGSTSLIGSIQFHVLAWYSLWFFGGDQVWYRACDLVLFRKPSPHDFEMFCTLFGVAVYWYSCLWYAMACLLYGGYYRFES